MLNITHDEFTKAYAFEIAGNNQANMNQELIIMGAVELFWEHGKNIAYLQDAIRYASSRRGMRVKAVKAFLVNFTGAKWSNKMGDKNFAKGGKMVEMPTEFEALTSWLDWADAQAEEPAYDLKKEQLKVISFMQKTKEKAEANNQPKFAKDIVHAMVAYAESEQVQVG